MALSQNVFVSPHCYPLLQEMQQIVKKTHIQEDIKRDEAINKVSFANLKTLLRQSPFRVIEIVGPQIMEPLVIILNQGKLMESDAVDLLECLETVLERSQVEDYNLLYRIIIGSCKLFGPKTENVETCVLVSDELSASILKLLANILRQFSHNSDLNELILTYRNLPLIAMIVQNTLTYLALKEKLYPQNLQVLSVKLLGTLFQLETKHGKRFRALSQIIGSLFPGIASSLFKIILNSHSFKSASVVEVLRVLPGFFDLVLHAAANQKLDHNGSETGVKTGQMSDSISRLLPESQGENWLKKVIDNIQKFLASSENILPVSSWHKIRLQGLIFAEEVMSSCGSQLNIECLSSLIIIVTGLENDENEEISSLATNIRTKIADRRPSWFCCDEFQLKFCKNVLEFSAQIPKCSRLQNEDNFAALLSKILACLSVTDLKDNNFLRIENVLEMIFDNFASCLEVEIAKIQLITSAKENFSCCSDEELTITSAAFVADDLSINFKNVSSKHLKVIRKILRSFLSGTSPSTVFELLSIKMSQSCTDNSYRYITLFTLVVECFEIESSSDIEFLNASCQEKLKEAIICSNSLSRTAILHQLLCLRLVQSTCRAIKQRCDIKSIVYNVTALVAHEISSVAHSALQTLRCIALSYANCQSVSQLLEQNCDYIFSDCVLKLKHCQVYAEVINVLCIVLQYVGTKCLLFVKHVAVECSEQLKRMDLSGKNKAKLTERLFLLCSEVSRYLHRNYHSNRSTKGHSEPEEGTNSQDSNSKKNWANLGQRLASHLQMKNRKAKIDLNEATENSIRENSEIEVEDDASILENDPVHVQIAHRIIKISIYYIYSDSFKCKIYCLTAAESCFLVLSQAKTGNFLLPMIHKIWNAVCTRLRDDKPAVVLKACKLILLFSEISSDFVRRRVVQDCVPMLLRWVDTLSSEFLGKTLLSNYDKYTYDYKLFCLLVQKVPQLFVNCKIVPWDREITFNLSKAIVKISKVGAVPDELSSIARDTKLFLKKHEPAMIELLEFSWHLMSMLHLRLD